MLRPLVLFAAIAARYPVVRSDTLPFIRAAVARH